MPNDTLQRFRALALAGIAVQRVAIPIRRPRRTHEGPPMGPPGERPPEREVLSVVLWDEAEQYWRRCSQAWAPSLADLANRGVTRVLRGRAGSLEVEMRNGTHRARGLPAAWVPVIIAALTHRELVPVRRALRSGTVAFTPEAPR